MYLIQHLSSWLMMNFHYVYSFALDSILSTFLAIFPLTLSTLSKLIVLLLFVQHFSSASNKAPTEGADTNQSRNSTLRQIKGSTTLRSRTMLFACSVLLLGNKISIIVYYLALQMHALDIVFANPVAYIWLRCLAIFCRCVKNL